jgi:hypothetical protein
VYFRSLASEYGILLIDMSPIRPWNPSESGFASQCAVLAPLLALIFSCSVCAQTSLTFSTAPNPSTLGTPVTLTVSAGAASTVTFYDDSEVLGTVATVDGIATLKTHLLPAGLRQLDARVGFGPGHPAGVVHSSHNVIPAASNLARISTSPSVGAKSVSAAVADFNGDGKQDIAVANSYSNDVSVLLGEGNGTFLPAVNYGVGVHPRAVIAADFNRDGKTDLAVVNFGEISVSILLGNGDGTFQAESRYLAGYNAVALATADLNGDGITDLIIATGYDIEVLLGRGDGVFGAATSYAAGANVSAIAVADFNGDGMPDVAIANQSRGVVSILRGNGDGTLQPTTDIVVATDPRSLIVSDFTLTASSAAAPGLSYPAITVTVDIAANAASPQVNSVTVSGGGSTNATATDPTTIVADHAGCNFVCAWGRFQHSHHYHAQ